MVGLSGFMSSTFNYCRIKKIKLTWIYYSDISILEEKNISISVSNQYINLKKKSSNVHHYEIKNPDYSFNLINKLFIYESKDNFGFGRIFM